MIKEDDPEFTIVEVTTVEAPVVVETKKEVKTENNKTEPKQDPSLWTRDEIELLTKALVKFPVGTRDRYTLVSEFVGTRTVKEVISQTNIGKSETAQGFNLHFFFLFLFCC